MATADEYAAWIVANKDKKGTPDFEVVARAYQDAKANASAPKQQAKPIDPTDGMSAGQKMLAGIGSGMTDLAYGVGQRLGLVDQKTVDEKKRLDAPLLNTTAGAVGNVTGKVATGLPAILVPGANTLVGAGLIGGAQGLAEPTATGESTLKNALIGGAGGVGGVVVGRALGAAYQGVKGLIEPFTQGGQERIAGRVLNRFAENPNALASVSSQPTVTGATPTLAEAARDRGVASLQRALEQQDPQIAAKLAQRAADNNAARVNVIGSIAGDEGTRTAAVAARDAASGDMYKAATNAAYTVDDKLADLLKRPAVQQAMQRAKTLAENAGRKFTFGTETQAPFSGVGGRSVEASKQITGQGLQDLKMALDDMLTDPASGYAGAAGRGIKDLRSQVVSWMEGANPAFKDARTAYAAASKPINQMDVGQRLLEKAGPAIRDMDGNKRLTANAFSRMLDGEQQLVRQATGFKGVNALADVMSPEQMSKLQAVRNELELSSNLSQAANGPGSQTAKSLASQNMLRQILGPTGLPQSWAESTVLESLLRPVQFGMKAAEPRIQNKLADIMLDPELARAALKAAEGKQLSPAMRRALPLLQQAAQQSVPAAALVSRER
jgi:hypothetical protein